MSAESRLQLRLIHTVITLAVWGCASAEDPGPEDVQGGGSDWSYAWVPVVAPLVGGVLAGLISQLVF